MALQKFSSVEANLQKLSQEPPDSEPAQKTEPKYTLKHKAKIVLSNITVEPLMAFYVLPCVMSGLACQNLSLEKACRVNLQMDENICDALSARNVSGYAQEDEIAVQKLVAFMAAWRNVMYSFIPSVLLMFVGVIFVS